jgi:hypothetical protein
MPLEVCVWCSQQETVLARIRQHLKLGLDRRIGVLHSTDIYAKRLPILQEKTPDRFGSRELLRYAGQLRPACLNKHVTRIGGFRKYRSTAWI